MVAAGQMHVDRRIERARRCSQNAAMSSAFCLVLDAAKRQPTLPVQATSPARIEDASVARPSAAIAPRPPAQRRHPATPESSRFCQTVRRISPSPKSSRDCSEPAHLLGRHPARASASTPTQLRPGCFCVCTPICADAGRHRRGRWATASAGTRSSVRPASLRRRRDISRSPSRRAHT